MKHIGIVLIIAGLLLSSFGCATNRVRDDMFTDDGPGFFERLGGALIKSRAVKKYSDSIREAYRLPAGYGQQQVCTYQTVGMYTYRTCE